jgi:PAS domain S-box-containing protein
MKKFTLWLVIVYLVLGSIWLIAGSWFINRINVQIPDDNLQYAYDLKDMLFLVVSITSIALIMQARFGRVLLKEQLLNRQLMNRDEDVRKLLQSYMYVNEATRDCIWDFDIVKDQLKWISGYEEMFGYEDDGLQKAAFWSMQKIHPQDRDRVINLFQQLLKTKERKWAANYRYLCADGTYKFVADRGYLILNDQLKPVSMLGAIQDVHMVTTYQQQLEQQNAKLKEIAWLNSHEIRRPLCNITGIISMLKDGLDDPDSLSQLINMLEISAEELDQTIHRINLESQPVEVRVDPVNDISSGN